MLISKFYKNILQQAILFVLCGLLYSPVCFSQRRSAIVAKHLACQFLGVKDTDSVSLLSSSSRIFKRANSLGESFYVYKKSSKAKGFVIVSGREGMPNVLAFSDNNDFDIENVPSNVRYWLSCYDDEYIAETGKETIEHAIDGIRQGGMAPILENIQWGQGSPYNLQCPMYNGSQCVTGCVATAMSMVMKHYQYPACGKGTISYTTSTHKINVNRVLDTHPFSWDDMLDSYDGNATASQKTAIANIMASCGASVKMDYSPDGSGAYQYDMLLGYIKDFSYDDDAAFLIRDFFSNEAWHGLLISELNEGRPVNYAGSNRDDGGHSFIIDGYLPDNNSYYPYYHLNWGWNGRCDGYYYLADLHPRESGSNYTSRAFAEGQQMLIGVKPEDGIPQNERILCADEISLSKRSSLPGNNFSIILTSIYNLSYKSFSGNIYVMLEEQDSNERLIGKTRVQDLEFLTGTNRLKIDCIIPDDMLEGDYKVVLKSGISESSASEVYLPSSFKFTVGERSSDDEEEIDATLCTSEIEIYQNTEDVSKVNLRIYEVFNYKEETFSGIIQSVIKSRNNRMLLALGDSLYIHEMLSQDLIYNPIEIGFYFPDTLANGTYRLYVGVKPLKSKQYNDMMYYDRVEQERPRTYFLDIVAFDNEVRIGNKIFPRTSTSIHVVNKDDVSSLYQIYSASGQVIPSLQKKVNIIRMSNGATKKIICSP